MLRAHDLTIAGNNKLVVLCISCFSQISSIVFVILEGVELSVHEYDIYIRVRTLKAGEDIFVGRTLPFSLSLARCLTLFPFFYFNMYRYIGTCETTGRHFCDRALMQNQGGISSPHIT